MVHVPSIAALGLDAISSQTATRLRRTGAHNTAGVWVSGAPASTAFTGTFTPARGTDLLRVPEGTRSEAAFRFITRTELRATNSDGVTLADRVTFGGRTYEIEHVQPWGTGDFYDAIGVRVGD